MLRAFYQGITGMKGMADGLGVTGNNIANSKTNGYKSRQAQFEDLYYQGFKSATSTGEDYAGVNPIELGNGTKMKGVSINQSQGNLTYTGRNTDLAISGDGYFVVGDSEGQDRLYTRDGAFELSTDKKLVTSGGQYVLGWNVDPNTGKINTGAGVSPIEINLNQTSTPTESTSASASGNLNATAKVGTVVGMQLPTYDSLGARHDIDVNLIKTGEAPNSYTYIATPAKDFIKSASIESAVFQPSSEITDSIMKGQYQISTAPGANGTVDITVTDPSGSVLITKNVSDNDQTVSLSDGAEQWFTVDYKKGGVPSTAIFQVAEVGTMEFDANGRLSSMTGSGPNGTGQLDFTPQTTGQSMSVNLDLSSITGLASEDNVLIKESDGFPAASLTSYTIGDGGIISGYFSDGSIKAIGQVAVATFANSAGLSAQGENMFSVSANSGDPVISASGAGTAGTIKSGSLESSNVDVATELTDLMFYQKAYTANSKVITTANSVLDVAINLIR